MLPNEMLVRIVTSGIQAPSADNMQPWILRYDAGELRIYHDPSRALAMDLNACASHIAIGALIENLVLAASGEGYEAQVVYFPEQSSPGLVARLTFAHRRVAAEESLAGQIVARVTNRQPYATTRLRPCDEAELRAAAPDSSPASVRILTGPTVRRRCARLAMAADHWRFRQRALHEELFRTIRFSPAEVERTRDGLPLSTLGLGRVGAGMMRAIRPWRRAVRLHRFGLARMMAFHSYLMVLRSSAVAIVSIAGTRPGDYVQGGRAVERVWLQATRLGLSVQPLSPATLFFLAIPDPRERSRVQTLREELSDITSLRQDKAVVMVMRVGYAAPPSGRSLRRQVESVLTVS